MASGHLTTEMVSYPRSLAQFIDAKCRPWSHKSDANPPGGDNKPPGGDNPYDLLFSSSIAGVGKSNFLQKFYMVM